MIPCCHAYALYLGPTCCNSTIGGEQLGGEEMGQNDLIDLSEPLSEPFFSLTGFSLLLPNSVL
jgi:hypothetical protein